jgi:F0F1-type ATP synthase membrane subunit b/b'
MAALLENADAELSETELNKLQRIIEQARKEGR